MEIVSKISHFVLPSIIVIASIIILFGKRDYFSHFLKGAENGAVSAFKLLPTMCALVIGVNMLFASGATKILAELFAPLLSIVGIPKELFALVFTRPLSYGASIASFTDIVNRCGVDSFPAICASVIMASTDTVFYVACVYFADSKITKTRYFIPAALFISLFSVVLSCILCRLFFE